MMQRVQAPGWGTWLLAWLFVVQAAPVRAQFAQGGQGQGGPQPILVPLSGRATPGGAVTATVGAATTGVQVQGGLAGSIRAPEAASASPLTLADALRRGVEYNLGVLNLSQAVAQTRGQRIVARSALLPNISSDLTATRQQINLGAMGIRFNAPLPGFAFPGVVGPFNQIDVRARLTQVLFDRVAWNNYRSAAEAVRAAELSAEDANDAIVLAVAGSYLEAVAARARVDAVRAQLATATVLQEQTEQRRAAGLATQVDVGRSQVQALTQQQRLTVAQNDYAKQKIELARMIGLPPVEQYELGDDVAFAAAPAVAVDVALQQARESRADLKAADAHVRAAERARGAARAERLPSATLSADYGAIGNTLPDARATFAIVGRVRVPLWQGGHAAGVAMQSDAAVRQRRAELDDLSSQVEGDIRKAYLDLEAAASQVDVATRNQEVSRQTLTLTRQRFEAGISDNVEVVQAQEAVASAELDVINSVFAHNLAKVNLARAMGVAAERLPEFLRVP
jgi:outer membrane protein TolC